LLREVVHDDLLHPGEHGELHLAPRASRMEPPVPEQAGTAPPYGAQITDGDR